MFLFYWFAKIQFILNRINITFAIFVKNCSKKNSILAVSWKTCLPIWIFLVFKVIFQLKKNALNTWQARNGRKDTNAGNADIPTSAEGKSLFQGVVHDVKLKNRQLPIRCFMGAGFRCLPHLSWCILYAKDLTYLHMSCHACSKQGRWPAGSSRRS